MSKNNFKKGYSKGTMEKFCSPKGYKKEDAFLKTATEFLFAKDYVAEEKEPQDFKTDKFIYVVSCTQSSNDKTINIETYKKLKNGRKGDLLCSEFLQTTEIIYAKASRKYVVLSVAGKEKSKGLITRCSGKNYSIEGFFTHMTINDEYMPMFVVATKQYFNPFKKTPVSAIKSEKFSFSGYEYRDGKYHYEKCPFAEYVDVKSEYTY